MGLEKDLFDFVGREVHELTWRRNYPINPKVGLRALVNAFRAHGFEVINDTKKRRVLFGINPVLGRDSYKSFSFEVQLTYEEIFSGWKHNPASCPRTFYDSICMVYDKIDEFLRDSEELKSAREDWYETRSRDVIIIRKKMEKLWLPWFMRNHEHMLVSTSGEIPKLRKPNLFYKVMENFPLQLLRDAIFFRPTMGPTAETIVNDYPWNAPLRFNIEFSQEKSDSPFEFDGYRGYHPSESTLMDIFWGKYLDVLAKEKGYTLRDDEDRLRNLVVMGGDALKEGRFLSWGNF